MNYREKNLEEIYRKRKIEKALRGLKYSLFDVALALCLTTASYELEAHYPELISPGLLPPSPARLAISALNAYVIYDAALRIFRGEGISEKIVEKLGSFKERLKKFCGAIDGKRSYQKLENG
jgi:hypothetical protein